MSIGQRFLLPREYVFHRLVCQCLNGVLFIVVVFVILAIQELVGDLDAVQGLSVGALLFAICGLVLLFSFSKWHKKKTICLWTSSSICWSVSGKHNHVSVVFFLCYVYLQYLFFSHVGFEGRT